MVTIEYSIRMDYSTIKGEVEVVDDMDGDDRVEYVENIITERHGIIDPEMIGKNMNNGIENILFRCREQQMIVSSVNSVARSVYDYDYQNYDKVGAIRITHHVNRTSSIECDAVVRYIKCIEKKRRGKIAESYIVKFDKPYQLNTGRGPTTPQLYAYLQPNKDGTGGRIAPYFQRIPINFEWVLINTDYKHTGLFYPYTTIPEAPLDKGRVCSISYDYIQQQQLYYKCTNPTCEILHIYSKSSWDEWRKRNPQESKCIFKDGCEVIPFINTEGSAPPRR